MTGGESSGSDITPTERNCTNAMHAMGQGNMSCTAPRQSIESPAIYIRFFAKLGGGNEVPPVDTKATGETTFRITADGTTIKYKVDVTGFSDATGAHIHMGKAGANGDVIVDLLRDSMKNPSTLGMVIRGNITDSDLTGPMKEKTGSLVVGLKYET